MKTKKTIYCEGKFRKCHIDAEGYYRFWLNGKKVTLHRYLYQAYHKCSILPKIVVHHKDENKLNNHPNNLELMLKNEHSRLHNLKNQYACGYKNPNNNGSVHFHKRAKKWNARVYVNSVNIKRKSLGYFDTEKEAREACYNYYDKEYTK